MQLNYQNSVTEHFRKAFSTILGKIYQLLSTESDKQLEMTVQTYVKLMFINASLPKVDHVWKIVPRFLLIYLLLYIFFCIAQSGMDILMDSLAASQPQSVN